jgi:hypothetical protein
VIEQVNDFRVLALGTLTQWQIKTLLAIRPEAVWKPAVPAAGTCKHGCLLLAGFPKRGPLPAFIGILLGVVFWHHIGGDIPGKGPTNESPACRQ